MIKKHKIGAFKTNGLLLHKNSLHVSIYLEARSPKQNLLRGMRPATPPNFQNHYAFDALAW
jgi:hypothetical protein